MSENVPALPPGEGEFLFYQTEDGKTRIQVRLENNTVWLSQKVMAELFQTSVANINTHLRNIFEDSEIERDSVIKEYLITGPDGKKYRTKFYRLEAILAVGYRVRSHRGTQFRQWAAAVLGEYLLKGFVMNDEWLKEGPRPGRDYFDELLERIREIRASERRFYQKITDIYKQCSVDYDPHSEITQQFYATVQNKLHWAIHGHTAAEIIAHRAHADRPNMGLTTWKNAPHGKIRRADVTVAKNYLTEAELRELNRIVTMYLDFAEDQARRRLPMSMAQWVVRLDAFLEFNERDILTDAGRVSKAVADELALQHFERFQQQQRRIEAEQPTSDFDKLVDEARRLEGPRRPPQME